VKNALEWKKEEHGRDGKCVKRELAVGPIVVWAIVALASLVLGKGLLSISPF